MDLIYENCSDKNGSFVAKSEGEDIADKEALLELGREE